MELRRIAAAMLLAAILATPAHAQVTHNTVTLSWTTPGDDGNAGKATSFDLRYSTAPITASNYEQATRWSSMPIPGNSGVKQTVTVTGLLAQTTYYFAIKAADEVPNWGSISNIAQATTTPDTMAPASIRDLAIGWLFMGWHGIAGMRERSIGIE